MNIEFTASHVSTAADTSSYVSVTADSVSAEELLEQIDIEDAIAHYSMGNLLDGIGKDKCKEYFSLTEEE